MISYADFYPFSLLVSVAFQEGVLTSQGVMSKCYPEVSDFLDSEPVVLPIPPNDKIPMQVIKQVPMATLRNDRGWVCQTYFGRVDFSYSGFFDFEDSDLTEATKRIQLLVLSFTQALEQPVKRLGVVLRRVADNERPGLYLARHFCKDRWKSQPLNRPESFELHAHKVFELPESKIRVNSWVRNKSAKLSNNAESRSVVLVEQDMNTLTDVDMKMPAQEAQLLLKEMCYELDNVLSQYYPMQEELTQ